MSEIHIKKNKPKVNDGGHKAFGVDIDPNKDLCHVTEEDGSQSTYYKGTELNYDDYCTSLEERYHKRSKGKDFTSGSIGVFSGIGKGTLKKSYEA